MKSGHVLVVDEADKAPTNVTCILKTLVESGEMHLSDGRRIVSGESRASRCWRNKRRGRMLSQSGATHGCTR